MKIALLIPCTSKNRTWKSIKESYLYQLSLKTFLLTQDKEYEYKFFIGIDKYDPIFDSNEQQKEILKFKKVFKNVDFEFIEMSNIKKGHLTKMWNVLFKNAYNEQYDYFFQCGDDIHFTTKSWCKDCISTLQKHNNIGLTGPINNNSRIMTQAFVSRKHMEIFGWFFPEEIINWCCDDWYNWVYQPNYFFPLKNHYCSNLGGDPRYDINNNPNYLKNPLKAQQDTQNLRNFTRQLVETHKKLLHNYLNNN